MTRSPSPPLAHRAPSPVRVRERLSDIEVTGYIARRLRTIQAAEGRAPVGPSVTGSTVVGLLEVDWMGYTPRAAVVVAALFAAHDAGELG